ncbi:MAG: hypothetical protein H6502_02770 [Candidatus Woesearchaeota archaeon]|nr:MAG: hypothetical protein H6502_02770 [Candidatus Woesearchaeota archaeon]
MVEQIIANEQASAYETPRGKEWIPVAIGNVFKKARIAERPDSGHPITLRDNAIEFGYLAYQIASVYAAAIIAYNALEAILK